MQPRTLDQILAELAPQYDPQIQSIQQRQNEIPNQVNADITQAGALKDTAFGDILNGARRRGLGFAGIPLGEQAKYASDVYAPSVLKAQQSGRDQALSLQDAILGINERRNTLAQQLRQQEIDRAEQVRQFNENLNFQRQQADAQSRAASAFNPSLGGGANPAAAPATDPLKQRAFAAVNDLLGTKNDALIRKTYDAIRKSANYGNAYDQMKLQLIETLYPKAKAASNERQTVANTVQNPLGKRPY